MSIKSLALLWMFLGHTEPSSIQDLVVMDELTCLADNIYYEARGEPTVGQVMVALTTLNRADLNKFPPSVCAVVYQSHQFSWTRDKELLARPKDMKSWYKAASIAVMTYTGMVLDISKGATHYYAYKLVDKPEWAMSMTKVKKVGGHYFFKETS